MRLETGAKPPAVCCGSVSQSDTRNASCSPTYWKAYAEVLPAKQHRAAGKGDGETCHVERFNNTLRQRLGRFVRRTMSFSKTDQMHEVYLLLFLHDYNTYIQDKLKHIL